MSAYAHEVAPGDRWGKQLKSILGIAASCGMLSMRHQSPVAAVEAMAAELSRLRRLVEQQASVIKQSEMRDPLFPVGSLVSVNGWSGYWEVEAVDFSAHPGPYRLRAINPDDSEPFSANGVIGLNREPVQISAAVEQLSGIVAAAPGPSP